MQVAVLNRDQFAEFFFVYVHHHRGHAERRAQVERSDMHGHTVLHTEQGHPFDMVLDGVRMWRFLPHRDLNRVLAALVAFDQFDHRYVLLFTFLTRTFDQFSKLHTASFEST